MADAGFRGTTVEQVVDEVASREVGAREQVERALAEIERLDTTVHAFVAVDAERALAGADEIDRRVAAGDDVGPLVGVPLAGPTGRVSQLPVDAHWRTARRPCRPRGRAAERRRSAPDG